MHMTVDVNEDEIVLIIQLLNQHIVKLQRASIERTQSPMPEPTPFEAQLITRLVTARETAIAESRMPNRN